MGEFQPTFWATRQRTPVYYPNLVTLSPALSLTSDESGLVELLTLPEDYPLSFKDSFATLDLTSYGFRELFQAQWIFHQAPASFSQPETADLQWQQITSAPELQRWEDAWSRAEPLSGRLFLPALLNNADISIIAAYRGDQIVAGGIANRTTAVVGLSNVFMPAHEIERYWLGLLSQIIARYPMHPIVGYEKDESLAQALQVGFITLGALRVWLKAA